MCNKNHHNVLIKTIKTILKIEHVYNNINNAEVSL